MNACALDDGQEKDKKINLINYAIGRLGNDLNLLREKQSAEISVLCPKGLHKWRITFTSLFDS